MINLETITLGLLIAFLAFWTGWGFYQKRKRLPPGPFPWPIIGNVLEIKRAHPTAKYVSYVKMAEKYGDIFYFKMGMTDTVVINGFENVKLVLAADDFFDRIDNPWFIHRSFGKKIGIISGSATTRDGMWRHTRRFTMRHLRDFGFGIRRSMQIFANREMTDLAHTLDGYINDEDGIIDPSILFNIPSANLAWASIAGYRFEPDDVRSTKLVDLMAQYTNIADFSSGPANMYPFLMNWFPFLFKMNQIYRIDDEIHKFLKQLVKDYRERRHTLTEPGSFLELFLNKMDELQKEKVEDDPFFNEENLIVILYDLFLGASGTTSALLTFAPLWLTLHPEVQDKMHKEIEDVIGHRAPQLEDRPNLPYVRATILELHRRSHILPLVVRRVYKDAELKGYVIPKGTNVICNLYSIFMDKQHWGDPENFRPERFLNEKNDIVNAERVIPFGFGRRNCIGESIAETAIFSFVTLIVQNYQLFPAYTGQCFKMEASGGIITTLEPYKVKIQRRQ